MINYNNRKFRPLQNTENGEVDEDTIFEYQQQGNIVFCTYSGRKIKHGHLIALVSEDGSLDMRYHQVNAAGQLMTGICHSTPEMLGNGKIRLYERWKWTSGDLSQGTSVLEEIY